MRSLFVGVSFLAGLVCCSSAKPQSANKAAPSGISSSSGSSGTATSSSGGTTSSSSSSGGTTSSSSSTGGVTPPNNGSTATTLTTQFEGQTRTYILVVPKNVDPNKSYPLVLSFHGNPGNAAGQAQFLPFETVSGDEAVVVYPQSLDPAGWDQYTPTDDNPDMKWVHTLPAEIATKAKIDLTKIYGFGWSGGSFFIVNFACRFGDMFRAISSNAGGGPDEEQSGFNQRDNTCYVCPGGPIATLVIHGARDDEVGRDSGQFTAICNADTNGCSEDEADIAPSPCKQFSGCPAKTPVNYCLIPNMGHQPWDQAMKQSWTFFTALP